MPSDWYEYECGTCGKEFPRGWRARDQHCEATGHSPPAYECDRCERHFSTYDAMFQHMESKNHFLYECQQCQETWPDKRQLKEHEANDHRPTLDYECDTCGRGFRTHDAMSQHMESKNHFSYQCRRCYQTWPSEEERKEHEADDHYLCAECDRSFNSRQDVRQHLHSRVHNKNSIFCPLCNKAYTTAAGVTHHVETGSCPKAARMDRDALFAFVRANDPKGAISKKLIGWHGEKKYEATDWAWNGSGYECFYFCHKSFSTLQSLNQHLASPIHQQALYHCPNTKCAKDFNILGALISHLESEKCGAMRFDKVQAGVESLIRGGRLLT